MIDKAKEYGRKSFDKGVPCAPALDRDLIELVRFVDHKERMKAMEAWKKSWIEESLKDDSEKRFIGHEELKRKMEGKSLYDKRMPLDKMLDKIYTEKKSNETKR